MRNEDHHYVTDARRREATFKLPADRHLTIFRGLRRISSDYVASSLPQFHDGSRNADGFQSAHRKYRALIKSLSSQVLLLPQFCRCRWIF